ncbi:MAG TPA: ABC transporter substrate-binding protein [Stellaceae bacterium]|nr:ABC transporter substrate-binding protein [Stellaceae bacterium]
MNAQGFAKATAVAWLALTAIAPASAATKINLLYIPGGDFVPAFVAKDQGIFDKHGLDVDMSIAQNGSVISAALAADQAQIGVPTPPVLLQANEQGLDLVVVAGATVLPFPKNAAGVIARAGIDSPKDLAGKKVAVPGFGGSFDVITRYWVGTQGVDIHKVNWIELQFPQMGDGLKSGLADAVLAVNPFYAHILDGKLGHDIGNPWDSAPAGTMIVLYASTRVWAAKNPEAVKGFRASLEDAIAYLKDPAHLQSVRDSIAKWTKLPPAAAASIAIPDDLEPQAKPDGLTFWIKAARDQGLIKGNPDPAGLIAP